MLPALFLLFSPEPARASTDATLGMAVQAGSLGPSATLSGRVRFESGVQLGARVDGALARDWYLDGWPVRRGAGLGGVANLTLPLVGRPELRLDLEIDGGLRGLWASDTDAPSDRNTVVLADVSPMATVPVGRAAAVRLGWKQVTHLQVGPSFGLEASGSLLRAGVVVAPSDDWQIGLEGTAGGVFGFNGDGGKAVAQAGLVARWVPGAARTYTNH